MELLFLGGAGTVTGSKYLLEHNGERILVDCGLFQGLKQFRLRNWAKFPTEPSTVSSVILTHAHIDHTGYLPCFVRDGYKGPVYCTHATQDLCGLLLPDSAYLQEQDANFANRHRFSKHKPALPLYTAADVSRALRLFSPLPFGQDHRLAPGIAVRFRRAGHILGAAIVELDWNGVKVVFSGDLGRYNDPMMVDPTAVREADYLIVESTYGDSSSRTKRSARGSCQDY